MSDLVLDTSTSVPLLVQSHPAHKATLRHVGSRRTRLTGHSLAETYSVLTRLPGDARVSPLDAVTLIDGNFAAPALLDDETASSLPSLLAAAGVSGGATYDGMVGLAARQAGVPLLTRDKRAASTYVALKVEIDFVGE